ncbi:helix-turn-helix transcriptional regulator [Roseovarius sp. Pro17]|uniref:helix-turn-helix transcriptional regulator n=1 Tax=Roseovarius sp. Pro17 TaxID=3108175 RepID=UPI002D772953|nr:helix-turn-helix transcriptional regulator [Roseovarius sp. Pro17]
MTTIDRNTCDIGNLAADLAHVVDAIGTPDFMDVLTRAMRRAVPFDNAMLFAYKEGERPRGPYTDIAEPAEARIVVDQYLLGPFLLDPFYSEVQQGRTGGLACLGDIAPDEFFASEYYEQHYRRTRITDEAGIFLAVPDGAVLVYSVTRRHGGPAFAPGEVAWLRALAPLVSALARRHWAGVDLGFGSAAGAGNAPDPIAAALAALGENVLSQRQRQVVALVLKGHSTEAIALKLEISADTVKVHRRHAYAKLGISSQAELFAMFLDLLSRIVAPGGERQTPLKSGSPAV